MMSASQELRSIIQVPITFLMLYKAA